VSCSFALISSFLRRDTQVRITDQLTNEALPPVERQWDWTSVAQDSSSPPYRSLPHRTHKTATQSTEQKQHKGTSFQPTRLFLLLTPTTLWTSVQCCIGEPLPNFVFLATTEGKRQCFPPRRLILSQVASHISHIESYLHAHSDMVQCSQ